MIFFSSFSFSFDLSNLQQKMSLLEIDMVPNENADTNLSSSPISRRISTRRSSSTSADSLHRTNRRVITKPKKNLKSCLVNPTTENEIRKFYLNQKMSKLKSTLLETIFESQNEEDSFSADDDDVSGSGSANVIGNRKIKRCLSFTVASHPTKTLVQKRRKRIQTVLGGKSKTKKMSMATFMMKLQAIHNSNEKCGEEKD